MTRFLVAACLLAVIAWFGIATGGGLAVVVVVAALVVMARGLGLWRPGGPPPLPSPTGPTTEFDWLDEEVSRCRRYNRELSIVVVALPDRPDLAQRATAVSSMLRASDRLILDRGNRQLIALCPETADSGAKALGARLEQQLSISASWSTATFPPDALTADALLGTARSRLAEAGR